jgi:hypothetical protein
MGFEQGSLRLLGNINRRTVQEHTWRKMRDYMNQGFGHSVARRLSRFEKQSKQVI